MRSSGLRAEHLILASAEDGPTRLDVFRTALERAVQFIDGHGSEICIERVVLIGDGVWHVAVARARGVPFVGRGPGIDAERLAQAAVRTLLPDFQDVPATLASLHSAESHQRLSEVSQ